MEHQNVRIKFVLEQCTVVLLLTILYVLSHQQKEHHEALSTMRLDFGTSLLFLHTVKFLSDQ